MHIAIREPASAMQNTQCHIPEATSLFSIMIVISVSRCKDNNNPPNRQAIRGIYLCNTQKGITLVHHYDTSPTLAAWRNNREIFFSKVLCKDDICHKIHFILG
jgi:hypothetical protein